MADTPNDQLAAARQAVADAQKQVDADLAAADQAMAAATSACADLTGSSTGSGQTQQATTTTTAPTSDSDDVGARHDVLGAVQAAQQQLHTSQNAVAEASSHPDTLLSQQTPSSGSASGSGSPSFSNGPSSSNTTHQGGSTGTPTGSTSSAPSSGPSSADLISDQKAVDAANDQVAAAQQALLQASIVSPIDGTVVSVNLAPGDTVSAGSSTVNLVIAGPGGYEAVTMVKVTDLPQPAPRGKRPRWNRTGWAGRSPDRSSRSDRQHVGHHRHDLSSHHRSHR